MPARGRWIVLLLLLGCGSKTGLEIPPPEGMDAGTDAAVGIDARPPDPDGGPDAGPVCEPFRREASLASLDIVLLLDSSGSMSQLTFDGMTKAEAVVAALFAFLRAPESEGLGVGLTFFPEIQEDVPLYCSNDAQCGEPDACLRYGLCYPSGEIFCGDASDCVVAGDTCEPIGFCPSVDEPCLRSLPFACSDGSRCEDLGGCANRTSCEVSDYARPDVPVRLLPEAAARLVSEMEAREQVGGTPTRPALEGAIEAARGRSADSPGSKVIVLLATDGFPANCDPAIDVFGEIDPSSGIPAVREVAAAGAADGIETFVVGVFAPDEEMEARSNLSTIAMAGGSERALVVSTEEPVADRLLAILNELRRSVRTCVYAIPGEGVLPDPFELQVRILPPDGPPIELERREGPMDCDPMEGGFFFEQDIEGGARPGFVELCPASCSITAADSDFVVEMQTECEE